MTSSKLKPSHTERVLNIYTQESVIHEASFFVIFISSERQTPKSGLPEPERGASTVQSSVAFCAIVLVSRQRYLALETLPKARWTHLLHG
ncbi:MAG: hypothetical protein KME49_09740 [Brasilonema octagenarum HA4186-MV1]|uniref:hypothetical protein n=1 Tax=Brasilonema TaxID=383614 RepID=UPI001556CEA4|nr:MULTISPECIES: hypothetical protein [Brasilonema]MBW4625765.1 hypothetical protein [Brasilonema octagenarum HA4186-MV1]